MPILSIVIPATGRHEEMEQGLVSVLQHRPANSEVIVVLNRPYGDPYELKDELTLVPLPSRSSWIACARAGLELASAPIVHLLGGGCEVAEDWTLPALALFRDASVAAVAPQVFEASRRERVRSRGVSYAAYGRVTRATGAPASSDGAVLGPELTSAFYRREALAAIGGLPADLSIEAAAAEVGLRLRAAGYQARLAAGSHVFAAPTEIAAGAFRTASDAERLFWRHLPSQGGLAALAIHPWIAAYEVAKDLPRPAAGLRMLGRLWGCRELLGVGRYRQGLRSLRETAAGSAPSAVLTMPIPDARRAKAA